MRWLAAPVLALGCVLFAPSLAAAQQLDVGAATDTVCAVMSGTQKPDAHAIQLLLLMDEDMADANPVSTALYRRVLTQCPKAYVAYEQRLRSHNPFKAGSFTNGQVSLGGTPAPAATPRVFALRCKGGAHVASSSGARLDMNFTRAPGPAGAGLAAGQCAWSDRAVAANEPTHAVATLDTPGRAQNGVKAINAGGTWTFWVFARGGALVTTRIAKGFPPS